MNTRDLEAFVAVVETGSIVAASARLNLTQPGVTRRVQSLEEKLGAALLDRQTKPLKPTSAGRDAYEHGRRVLRSVEDLKSGVAMDGEIRGDFRLGIMPYLSDAALAHPLDRLRGAFPKLALQITSGWSPRLLDQVGRNELDAVALCLADGMDVPDGLTGRDLGVQAVLLVAAPQLGIASRANLADLARHPWVMNESGCGYRGFIRRQLESRRLPFQVGVEALSVDLRMSLVARGLGIGIVTPAALEASPWRDSVRVIEVADFKPQVRSWVLHRPPAGRFERPIEKFAEALGEALRSNPNPV